MAVRHQLIARKPSAVWAILGDESRYAEWVVGTRDTAPAEGNWPDVGSSLAYTVPLGRVEFEGRTVVRRYEPSRILELEAQSGPLGTARIALDVRAWGEHTLVILDEHPLRGPGALLHNTILDALLQIRHRSMLGRLAKLVEETFPEDSAQAAHA